MNVKGQFYPIKAKEKWGYIDKTGKVVLECKYDDVGEFRGIYAFTSMNGKLGVIDTGFNEILPTIYRRIIVLENGYFAIAIDSLLRLHHLTKQLADTCYNREFEYHTDHLFTYNDGDGFRLINEHGKALNKLFFDKLRLSYSEELIEVINNRKIGLLDSTGETILHCEHDFLHLSINEKLVLFGDHHHFSFINLNTGFTSPKDFYGYQELDERYILLKRSMDQVIYDIQEDQIVFEGRYDEYHNYNKNFISFKKEGKYGLISRNEFFYISPSFDAIKYIGKDRYAARYPEKWLIGTKDGKILDLPEVQKVEILRDDKIIRLHSFELMAYLKPDGDWIYPFPKE